MSPEPTGPRSRPRRARGAPRPHRLLAALLVTTGLLVACGGGGGGGEATVESATTDAGAPVTAGASATPAPAGDATGGTLRIAMSAGNVPFPSTPPNEGYEGYRFVGNNIYDGLTRYDLDQAEKIPTPQPSLAESWTVSPDQLTWTFKLRQGVTFHDGTPFDADAVIFQFDRMAKPDFAFYDKINAPRYAPQFRFFKEWAKVDASTVTITTTSPYGWLLHDLAHIYFPSPTVVQAVGNEKYNTKATGTGPFLMTKYVDGETMVLTANETYWRGRPKLDTIELYPQPEPASRLSALQSGEVEWAEVPSPDALDQLKADGFQIMLGKYPHGIMPMYNQHRAPFKDNLALRQALNYALDRTGTAALINGVGYPATQYVYEGHPHFSKGTAGYTYDVDKAKTLLAEAGVAPGSLSLKVAYPTGGSGNMFPGPMMEKLQADFKAVGVNVELMPMEWNTLISAIIEGLDKPKWSEIDILWSSPAAGMTPAGYVRTFLCTQKSGAPNPAGICNKGLDDNYLAASAEFDVDKSNTLLQQGMTATVDNADFLFWMHDLNLRVLSPAVKGYVHPQSWWVDFTTIAVED